MPTTTQADRLLQISTPMGADYLLIKRIRSREALSHLFSFEIDLLHEEDDPGSEPTFVDPQQLLGQSMTVKAEQRDGTKRFFNGICVSFTQGNRNDRFSKYQCELVPKVWLLTQNVRSRIFQNMSVPDILRRVLEGFEFDVEIQGTFEPRNYCVQYRESDWDFASRLMEDEGIFYYFEHTASSHRLIIANTDTSHRPCPERARIPFVNDASALEEWNGMILTWHNASRLPTGKYTLRDHHFQLPTNDLEASQISRFNIGGNQDLELYDFPGGFAKRFDGIDSGGGDQASELQKVFTDRQRTTDIRQQELDVNYKTSYATGDCCSLTAGYKFELTAHPAAENNRNHILVNVQTEAVQTPSYVSDDVVANAYLVNFASIPQGAGQAPFRPDRRTKRPTVSGSQTAIVVGPQGEEIFTDKYGRVKVQFHWDREGKNDASSSCWLRVSTSIAGNKWGTMFIPRIGQEVIVDFMEGDPDQPIITGSVYNPETMPHYDLPKYKTLSYIKTRTSPDDGKGFNELRFEDKAGKEQVFVRSQKRYDLRVRGSMYETCGGNRQEVIGVRSDNQPGGNLAISVGGNYDLHVKVDNFIGIDGKLNHGVKGDVVEGFDANQQTVVKSKVQINAQDITLEGSQKVTLKVGSSCVIVDMMGITIQGPMVKINSGGFALPTLPAIIDDPLDAETADTGEPGYLDRPRSGGGSGRRRRTLNGQHAPSVAYHPASGASPAYYAVGGDHLRVEGNDAFVGKALGDLSTLYNTPTGRHTMDGINAGTHNTTIRELPIAQAPGVGGGQATRVNQAGSTTPGTGSDTIIEYAPDYVPTYTDQNGNSVNGVRPAVLGHEMIHATHNDAGTNLRNNPDPAEPTSNEEESQTIGVNSHANDPNTENHLIHELGGDYQRTDHDFNAVTP